MRCLRCKSKLMHFNKGITTVYRCVSCNCLYRFNRQSELLIPMGVCESIGQVKENIPPISLGKEVYIDNLEHEFCLEQGIVIGRDHGHYRIKFCSLDKRINGKKIWVPTHWVKILDI
jgi:hypothetical protein